MGIRNLPNEQNFFSRKRTEQSRRPNFARFEIFLPPNKENVSANWHILEESLDSWTSLGQEDNSPSPPQIKSVDGSAHVRSLHFSFLVSIAITMTSLQPDCPPTSAAPDLTMYHHNKRRRHEESSSITKYLLQHPAVIGFLPGAVGGTCNVLVGHPLDLIKVRQQCQPPATPTLAASRLLSTTTAVNMSTRTSTVGMLRSIVRTEGWIGLYAGISAPLLAVVPAFGITFWSFDVAKSVLLEQNRRINACEMHSPYRSLSQPPERLTIGQTALAGGFSGIPLALVLGPLEKAKCEFQVHSHKYANLTDCFRQSYQQGGFRNIFRGTGMSMLRDVPGNAAYFGAYEFFRRQFCHYRHESSPSLTTTLLAGGLAGVCNWTVAIPMDVIKSRWQVAMPGTYRTPMDVAIQLVATDGLPALFRGLAPALLRAFPSNAACLLGVETARSLLSAER